MMKLTYGIALAGVLLSGCFNEKPDYVQAADECKYDILKVCPDCDLDPNWSTEQETKLFSSCMETKGFSFNSDQAEGQCSPGYILDVSCYKPKSLLKRLNEFRISIGVGR